MASEVSANTGFNNLNETFARYESKEITFYKIALSKQTWVLLVRKVCLINYRLPNFTH